MSLLVIGASGGPGRLLFEQLRDAGEDVIGIARHRNALAADTATARFIETDASNTETLVALVDEDTTLIHCSRPEFLTALLALKPRLKRVIAIGSTRIYTRYPDDKCARLAAMAHAIWMGDIPATLLHPTMIYGAPELNNIERVVKVARLSPVIPLPASGKALIQPVLAADVVRGIRACLADETTIGRTIVLAGRQAVSYREFIECCIRTANLKCRVISMPYPLVWLLAPVTTLIPGIPDISHDEIRRLLEDKNFSTGDMIDLTGENPVDIAEGLTIALTDKRHDID